MVSWSLSGPPPEDKKEDIFTFPSSLAPKEWQDEGEDGFGRYQVGQRKKRAE